MADCEGLANSERSKSWVDKREVPKYVEAGL